ncbi:MAG: YhcG family protein [Leptolyngbyaceae cyanobacterium]
MPRKSSLPAPNDQNYSALLNGLKTRIRSAQVKAAIAVNQELILLYWHIGKEILARQQEQGWGAGVISRLAQDLRQEFPDMKGFSARSLGYMKAFAAAWPDESNLQRSIANLPWRHNIALLEKLKEPIQRLWYAREAVENGWSREILVAQIETGLYQREGAAINNFERTLPHPQSELAQDIIKDPYTFNFLPLAKDAKKQDLKRALVDHMREFLVELGIGFSYVGKNYHLDIGGQDFYLDLLFYHLELRCYIIIELKMDEFQAEYSGKMNLYISAVDEQKRKAYDQPTIGLILCKSKNKTIAEYALRGLHKPIAVATHQLPEVLQDELPSPEQLELELNNAVQKLEGEGEILEVKAQPEAITATPEKLAEVVLEVQRRLKLLQEMNPTASQKEISAFVTAAIPLTLQQQAARAWQSLGKTAIQELLDEAYADTAIALMEGWLDET